LYSFLYAAHFGLHFGTLNKTMEYQMNKTNMCLKKN